MADELLGVLQTLRGTFSLGLLCWAVVKDPETQALIHSHDVCILKQGLRAVKQGQNRKIPAGTEVYDVAVSGPGVPNDYDHLSQELSKMLLRNFSADCFEAVKEYCEKSEQIKEMQSQPWYQFARIVRNSLTHTQYWKFTPYDLSLLPITWNGKKIDASLQGKESDSIVCNWFDACVLYAAMYSFAQSLK